MTTEKRLTKLYKKAAEIHFNNSSKIIMMSDLHRGTGDNADDFLNNQHLAYHALDYYYNQGFSYFELGDGDELWENKEIREIAQCHKDMFTLLEQFSNDNRLCMIYGNHDVVKKNYPIRRAKKRSVFLEKLTIPEALILNHTDTNNKIFLVHGHQGDLINDGWWKLGRFLVRTLWRPLQNIGINDPTSAAKNYKKKNKLETQIADWANKNKQLLVCGHTHKPTLRKPGKSFYINTGSCVHPKCITGIEITEGNITLIEWKTKTREDGTLYVGKEKIAGPFKLSEYFKTV